MRLILGALAGGGALTGIAALLAGASAIPGAWLGPVALVGTRDGRQLWVAGARAGQLLAYDPIRGVPARRWPMPGTPSGLALSPDEHRLYVTCAGPTSSIVVLDLPSGRELRRIAGRHGTSSPVVSPDGGRLYVCHRFDHSISAYDLATGNEVAHVRVSREPVSAVLTPDGRQLLVAHHLPTGRADADQVRAVVSVLDLDPPRVRREIPLPNGSGLLRQIAVAPDGRHAVVTHILARFYLPTTQLDRGWMNNNALSVIDLAQPAPVQTVLLDDVDRGAANPWGVAWTQDGRWLGVAHAGTHELSVIDWPALVARLGRTSTDPASDFSVLTGLRRRVPLAGRGPRAVWGQADRLEVASFFSDTLETVPPEATPERVAPARRLGPTPVESATRAGERWFNDATLCFQGWQSCASCHSDDARVDGLNWDLLNDGLGNPKNTRSLLDAFRTAPAMSLAVRDTAADAVRAGLRHILFTEQPESVARALDCWLESLRPLASPHLEAGGLSTAARRGQRLFADPASGCARCHRTRWFTDRRRYDVGTTGPLDRPGTDFDTPGLRELWRTAPYLHDGSAATLRDVLRDCNPGDHHGRTSHLTDTQVDDLVAYLLSL